MRRLLRVVVVAGSLLTACGTDIPAASDSPDAKASAPASEFRQVVCAYPDEPIGSGEDREALGRKALELGRKQNGRLSPRADSDLQFLLHTLPTLAYVPMGQKFHSGSPPPLPNGQAMPQTLETALDAIRDACA